MRRVACLALLASCYRAPEQCDVNASFECQGDPRPDSFDFWPFVVELFPPDNAKGVPLGITPTVKFTEQVTGVSSSSFVLSPTTTALVEYDAATRIASLHPDGELAPSTQYVATLTAEIKDFTGNTIYGKKSWTFKTLHDTTSPTVAMVAPADGATNVPIHSTEIVATFSEQVSHVTQSTFYIEGVPATLGYVSPTAVKLTPTIQLAPHTVYTATLAAGITDLIGNPLVDAPITWSFTTGADTIPPAIGFHIPAVDETDVDVMAKVSVQFDEPVVGVSAASFTLEHAGGAVAATVTYDALARRARLSPAASLAPSTSYTARLTSAITDTSGNPIVPASWMFTTTAPTP